MQYKNAYLRGRIGPPVSLIFRGAAAAYSTRIPSESAYSGPLMRVRESAGNTEQDIYASSVADVYGNQWLDTTALLAFVGANNGFVTTWYDQSGGGNHMVQATAGSQPRIVLAGAVDLSNGKPAIWTTTSLSIAVNPAPFLITGNADRTLNGVQHRQSGTAGIIWSGVTSTAGSWGIDNSSVTLYAPYVIGTGDVTSTALATGTAHVITAIHKAGTSFGFANGAQRGTPNSTVLGTLATNGLGIGVRAVGGTVTTGFYSEVAYWPYGLSTSARQLLERSQGNAFGIIVA